MITRVVLILAGVIVAVFGVLLLWETVPHETYLNLGIWLVAGVVLHDLLVAALVAGGGWLVAKYVPTRFRRYVQAGAVVAGTVIVMAIPVLIAGGRTPVNPSLLPLNYWLNLAIVLAIVAGVTVLVAVVDLRRRSLRESSEHSPV